MARGLPRDACRATQVGRKLLDEVRMSIDLAVKEAEAGAGAADRGGKYLGWQKKHAAYKKRCFIIILVKITTQK